VAVSIQVENRDGSAELLPAKWAAWPEGAGNPVELWVLLAQCGCILASDRSWPCLRHMQARSISAYGDLGRSGRRKINVTW
jgi:hypothetical protein